MKPVISAAAPLRKPSTTTAKSRRSKSLARMPPPPPINAESAAVTDDSGDESTDADSASDGTAPKAHNPPPQPSNTESSEDDDDLVEESTDAPSASEDTVPKAQNPHPKPLATKPSDSDDSGSDSESPGQLFEIPHSAHVTEPQASMPLDAPTQSRQPLMRSKDDELSRQPLLWSKDDELAQSRQPLMWIKDDELALLNGLVDYNENKGFVPTSPAAMDDFHEFIQKSLIINVNNTQLYNKIRGLKRKYLAAAPRGKIKTTPSPSKYFDQDIIELCNQIWGSGRKSVISGKDNAGKYVEDEVTRDEFDSLDSIARLREIVLKTATKHTAAFVAAEAVEMVDVAKAEKIVERHNKLSLLEMKHSLRRTALMQETVKLFMEAVEKLV